ncbi:hypothetical protein K466DRAFT_478404 [Polyporus arcularius HHB13444]|uniref:Aprataxin and PNK-like factor PBZ domain-containing protein n=1 Tax=Polyporus arcularius HHB13444 TaxID=1314778 RepID=A0A5C3Q558_9APHY|nr:hypothetical protein K466DRAFT_478404 [Polyporus arcularius HHB13444]
MFNDAFKVHPRSIVHEVLVNIAGPAVPQAARCAHYKQQSRRGDGLDIDQLPSEEHYRSLDWMPNKALANTLEENHKAVRILEDFYSQRNKDRTSSTSQLEPQESLRFQRAMYRYWLYLDMLTEGAFEPDDDEFDDADDDDNDDDFEERRDKYFREGFKKFLVCLSTDELLEVLSAGAFCEETMQWQSRGLPNETVVAYSFSDVDPGALGKNLERGYTTPSYRSSWSPAQDIIHGILLSRKVNSDELDQKRSKAILQTVNGADDTCGRCDAVGGVQLIGTANVSLLAGVLSLNERFALLPGILARNREETRKMTEYLLKGRNGGRVSEEELFDELIDTVPDTDGDDDDEQHQWSKDEWYCLACIKDLFRQRFMVWWRQTKEKNGAPHVDDCWYGYNCRTMTHRSSHALKLNHLCTPTRGDAPKPPQQPTNPN